MSAVRVGIIMGSSSDWPTVGSAAEVLEELGIGVETRVLSAHRTPNDLLAYGAGAADRGLAVLIGAAGGAAHLPGMLASVTDLPVIGLPVPVGPLDGLDALLSIVQMPGGVPVATVSIGGGRNAGLLAARILGATDRDVRKRVSAYRSELADLSRAQDAELRGARSC